jgi:formate hydrogenlyase subunit 3/multisubunit Na+/H+ antiporter MnhD subunit
MEMLDGRDETPTERLDRNWNELLQELRVTQTGVQLLTAFLLSLPLQQRFSDLKTYQHGIYLATVILSVSATGFLVLPVAAHRAMFRRHKKGQLVDIGNRAAQIGIVLLGLAVSMVVGFIFSVVVNEMAAAVAGTLTLVMLAALWWVVPHRALRRDDG